MRCNNCGLWKGENAFKEAQRYGWCLRSRTCIACAEKRQCRGRCGEWLEENKFTPFEWKHAGKPNDTRGRCRECSQRNRERKPCSVCKKRLLREQFASTDQWFSNDDERKCPDCRQSKAKHGYWACCNCKKEKPKLEFSKVLSKRDSQKKRTTDRCNACVDEEEATSLRIARENCAFVQK